LSGGVCGNVIVNYDIIVDQITSASLDEGNLFHLRVSGMFMSEDEVESNLLPEIPVVMLYLSVDVAVMAEKLTNN